MNGAEIDDILRRAHVRPVAKNAYVFEQGQPAGAFFVLLNGRLKVARSTTDGHQIVIRFVIPGDLFGISKPLGNDEYPGTASAVMESTVLSWDSALWDELTARHPTFATKAFVAMGQRIQEAHKRLEELSTEEVERRIAHAVLRLVQQAGRRTEQGMLIDFPISRQDIAEMTGTTLHTVSRYLRAWEQSGWVAGGRQRLLVRDACPLRALAAGQCDAHDPGSCRLPKDAKASEYPAGRRWRDCRD